MDELTQKHCVPCEGGEPPLDRERINDLLPHLNSAWQLHGEQEIARNFTLKNFTEALNFANKIGALAEEEGHHPDLLVSYGKLTVTLSTHAIKGLSENDFILAAKIDQISHP